MIVSSTQLLSKNRIFFFFALLFSVFTSLEMQGQATWVQKANFGGGVRYGASSFCIGDKCYTGTGIINSTTLTNDFWEFDPATNVWTQKANFSGGVRTSAMAFSIGSKGYIGLGTTTLATNIFPKDFWEYDPATNTWVQKTSFPGAGRYTVASFSIGTKGYMGTGWSGPRYGDFWEYDQVTNAWTQKATFGGVARQSATGFALNGKGYIGAGYSTTPLADFWEYNPANNTWVQKANFPGLARYGLVSMATGGNAYVGGGTNVSLFFNDFYKFDPVANAWTAIANYPGLGRVGMTSMSGASSAYAGTGSVTANYLGTMHSDFWELQINIPASITSGGSTILCPGGSVILTANAGAGYTYQWKLNGVIIPGATAISYTAAVGGNYSCMVSDGASINESNTITVTEGVALITSSGATGLCPGSTVTLNANSGTGSAYQWKLDGVDIAGATASAYIANQAGDYTCLVTIACGSLLSNVVSVTVGTAPPSIITAGGPTTFCTGGSVTLSANTGTGLTYQWKSNGTAISGATASSYPAITSGSYACEVTNAFGCKAVSNSISITVGLLPVASITPSGTIEVCQYSTLMLSANTGAGLTYQWQLGGVNLPGATNRDYFPDTYSPIAVPTITCIVSNSCGSVTSNSCTVHVLPLPPGIITAAGSTVICNGNSVVLNAATGPSALYYQWKNGFIDIPGATSSTYSATATGNYSCRITLSGCSVNSNSIQVTVSTVTPTASITAAGITALCPGGSVTLNANTGTGLLYQWQRNGIPIAGATTSAYNATIAGSYTCVVALNGCSNLSNVLVVTIPGSTTLFIQPNAASGMDALLASNPGLEGTNYGTTGEMNAMAWDIGTLAILRSLIRFDLSTIPSDAVVQSAEISLYNYPSSSNGGPPGSHYSANASWLQKVTSPWTENAVTWNSQPATTATGQASLPSSTSAHQDYVVNVTALVQDMIANPATNYGFMLRLQTETSNKALIFASSDNADPAKRPSISINYTVALSSTITAAGPTAFCQFGTVILNANTGTGLSHQWKLNGTDITGATSSSYNASAAGNYTCIVSNSCNSATSNVITVTMDALPTATITAGGTTTFCSGGSVTLLANTGTGLSHQWKLNGSDINGATASSYNATAPGSYTCLVSNSCGGTTSMGITVSINPLATAIITAAGSTAICTGSSVTLNANTGTGLTYQWKLNGTDISGATVASYNATAAGSYTCVVSNICGGTLSNSLIVSISPLPTAVITAAGSTAICQGSSVTLNANTGAGLTYQWKLNSNNITGATASSYNATAVGSYTCVVSNSCGGTTSNTINITVGPLPAAILTAGGSTAICQGSSVTLNANTGAGLTYQWKLNGTNITGATAASYSATAAGNYTCLVSNTCGGATSNSIAVTISPVPSAVITSPSPTGLCPGASVTMNAYASAGYTYQWKQNGTNISGATTSSYIATTIGSYTCAVTNACGTTISNTITVTSGTVPATPSVITGSNKVCPLTTESYYVNPLAGMTYTWTLPPNSSITTNYGNSIYVTFAANFNGGTLAVTATNGCGTSGARTRGISKNNRCGAFTSSSPTGMERMLDAVVYPNPSSDQFTLRILTNVSDGCMLIIHDLTGRVVERRDDISPGESVEFGKKLSGGVYLVEVIQGEERKVLRVVKSE